MLAKYRKMKERLDKYTDNFNKECEELLETVKEISDNTQKQTKQIKESDKKET